MTGPITVIAIIFLVASIWWLLKNKMPPNFFGKFKTLKTTGLDLGRILSILTGWVILHIIIMLAMPDVWVWYIGQVHLFLSVQITALTIALLVTFGGKLGFYMSVVIAVIVVSGFSIAILKDFGNRQTVANSVSPVARKIENPCGKPKIVLVTQERWSDSVKARIGCDWIARTDENAGLGNTYLCFKTRINGRDNLILTECGTSTETHFPENVIAWNMEFKSTGKPVQIKINFIPRE